MVATGQSTKRRCAVCRVSSTKDKLVRFVFDRVVLERPGDAAADRGQGGAAVVQLSADLLGTAPGRGAYCHTTAACMLHPKARDMIAGALRKKAASSRKESGGVETGLNKERVRPLREALEEALRSRSKAGGNGRRLKRSRPDEIECVLETALKGPVESRTPRIHSGKPKSVRL